MLALVAASCSNGGSSDEPPGAPAAPAPEASNRELLIGTTDAIAALPTEGEAWSTVLEASRRDLVAELRNQDRSSAAAVAAALVYVRTGDDGLRSRVVAALAQLPGTERDGRTLALGRQLAGWVIAADLIGYRDPAFLDWLDQVRTEDIGGHTRWRTLLQTHETTASNWGTLAGASRLAASLYVGDRADVDRAADVLKGWLGEEGGGAWPTLPDGGRRSARGFLPSGDFDRAWACEYPDWRPVNENCGSRSGALVEDISRGASFPDASDAGLKYSWEAMQGAMLQALLLSADGRTEVWDWGNQALRRAGEFLARSGAFEGDNFNTIHHWVPWVLDAVYDTDLATGPALAGRSFGFTDWLEPVVVSVTRVEG